ncbi:MAG: CDP-alcohol phosphatidyltransferase family protein [bacterium]|nr:CDP-alcohol phosphatidyltransferase family protein [bacterium]
MTLPPPPTLTDRVRTLTGQVTHSIALRLHRLGVHPDTLTILGLVVVFIASALIARGLFFPAAVLLIVGLPLDALDGALARVMQRKGRFGAVLDSSLDRYADGFIFASLSYYFAVQDQFNLILLALAALMGSFLVSYVRARAEGVGVDVKIGLFSRFERVVIILVMLLVPGLLAPGLLILAVGTNFTGLQRLWYVYTILKDREVR